MSVQASRWLCCASAASPPPRVSARPAAAGSGVAPGLEAAAQFPILQREIRSRRLIYLDNAASSQKPQAVLDAMSAYYAQVNSNVHRGVHTLAAEATDAYERARVQVASFINASSTSEVIWTRNASEAINLVAYSWGLENLKPGDEIISSVMEHHSNLVPWQMITKKTGAKLKFVGLNENQEFDVEQFQSLVNSKTKLVALAHVSNVLGSELPVKTVVDAAKSVGARVLLDSCQSVPHMPVDVQNLGADWIVASGHKMCGPTGIGFLWGRLDLLKEMPPFLGGGEMIMNVELEESTYAEPPLKFEAGTPAIGEAIGLGAACEYLSNIGMDKIHAYEKELGEYLYEKLAAIEGVSVYGPKKGRSALAAFNTSASHATDIATIIDHSGVAIRSGHHCTQPLHKYLGIPASARASLYFYNTREEVDEFISALEESIAFFADIGAP